jgi:mono/diheme cytochrome c family protein
MDKQSSKDAYERYGLPPEGSVPHFSVGAKVGSREEAIGLQNPVSPDEASTQRGELLFGMFCQVCHGSDGGGMGPVSTKFIPAPDIKSDYYRDLPDGHFYYIIRYGSAVMPAYGESMDGDDMWDIVNFIKKLQKRESRTE